MVDKERLKEIKKHRDEAENSIDEYEFEKINFYNLHVDWLIKQAERVQELEQENKQIKEAYQDRCDDIDGLLEYFDTSWEELIDE